MIKKILIHPLILFFDLLKKEGILILHRNKKTIDSLPNFFSTIEIRTYGISQIIFGKFLT
jgi:hypothetical protein